MFKTPYRYNMVLASFWSQSTSFSQGRKRLGIRFLNKLQCFDFIRNYGFNTSWLSLMCGLQHRGISTGVHSSVDMCYWDRFSFGLLCLPLSGAFVQFLLGLGSGLCRCMGTAVGAVVGRTMVVMVQVIMAPADGAEDDGRH